MTSGHFYSVHTIYEINSKIQHKHMKIDIIYAIIILTIIVLLSYAYLSSDYYYTHVVLKNAFEKLNGTEIKTMNPEMNWDIVNMNIDGYINNKKIVFNQPSVGNANEYKYTNKNALAAFMNNVLVIDIDSNEDIILTGHPNMDEKPLHHYLSKTTVSAKTPHGFHYYFYNDTGAPIPCRVGLTLNGKKYPVDLLTGHKQLIFLPPTRIENECYRWINSPMTHRIEPISKHMELLDVFAYTKEFSIQPEPMNACVSKTIPNIMCIVWDFQIIYQLKYKCTSTIFEQLHSNQHELLYRTNTTYYLFLKHKPMKYYKAHDFVQHVVDILEKHNINGGIVHLGLASVSKLNGNDSIAQFSACNVHNHKRYGLSAPFIKAEQTLIQTSVFNHESVSIISNDILHETNFNNDNDLIVSEDLFLIFMISNKVQIPCICLMQMTTHDDKDDKKCTKLIQYYMRNILNATHYSTSSTQPRLTFFSEVPMLYNTMTV